MITYVICDIVICCVSIEEETFILDKKTLLCFSTSKTFTGVLFCGTERPCKLSAKTESCIPNKQNRNWSICFQQAKKGQNFIFYCFLLSEK